MLRNLDYVKDLSYVHLINGQLTPKPQTEEFWTPFHRTSIQWQLPWQQCFIATQNPECHFTCHWMASCHWWQVLWNGALLPSRSRKTHLGSEVEPEPVWRHQWPSLVSLSKHPAEGKVQDVCAGVVAHHRSSPCLQNNQMTVKLSPLVDIFWCKILSVESQKGVNAVQRCSVENQKGQYQYSKMFRWEPEGQYRCTKSMAIAPFQFWTSLKSVNTLLPLSW